MANFTAFDAKLNLVFQQEFTKWMAEGRALLPPEDFKFFEDPVIRDIALDFFLGGIMRYEDLVDESISKQD